ncbi:flagellar basal body P-ring protein FlgI [Xylophilus rhododendri]|uniref:Flagellar P-ring protein n=1 Tax=Xylophilus rhododendri TaxID=2697032 RepID=A0A857J5C0_9BURK|nr:flagellar basal body P-ring protein FlgI [Xylophilus rhododendri]QHI99170.1 flagellar basal body P-ring protein FlgI [Xylophilus rhododendri]
MGTTVSPFTPATRRHPPRLLPGLALAVLSCLIACTALAAPAAGATRVKDLGKLQGWRDNALVGWGIVTGLAGTGDSPGNAATRQALANVFSQFNLAIPAAQIQSRNVAVVMIAASLPPFSREGDTLDITVTSAGDARSLLGGSLLLAPLKAADGHTYALAEGPLSVGGYRYDANGNVVQKNHPTVGSVPGGAKVEKGLQSAVLAEDGRLTFVLANPDYTTAARIASAINAQPGLGSARARDAEAIDIEVPADQRAQPVGFIARIEGLLVEPDGHARVVINERTGTVVAGGEVRISPVAVSQGDLRISIATVNSVSQPGAAWGAAAGGRTALVANSTVDVNEQAGGAFLPPGSSTVADLVQSLARLKTNTRDVISILRAIKAAGALHADLIVQ